MSEPAEPVSPTDTAPLPADGATPPRSWRDRVRRGLRRHEEEREVEEPASPAAGQLLAGRYRLGRELGRGGMGAVYEAEDTRLGRRVAIKLLLLERRSPQALERFQVEARAAARLRHPHIVGLLEVGEEGERQYQVMELVEVSDVHRNLGDLEDGLAAIQSAVQVHRPLVDADAHRYQKEHGTLLELLEEAQRDLALAKGEVQPRDTEEALGTAYLLCQRGEHARAIPLYRTVLSVPAVRADLEVAHLYNAAAAASCAAERTEDPAAREALLREGLGWLEEDLRRRRERLSALEAEAASPARDARLEAFRADLRRHLARAREGDPDLAALRGAPGFAELVGAR